MSSPIVTLVGRVPPEGTAFLREVVRGRRDEPVTWPAWVVGRSEALRLDSRLEPVDICALEARERDYAALAASASVSAIDQDAE